MPIKPFLVQRRHAELGRIRLGHKVVNANGKSYPAKLETFRFTSSMESYIRDLAALYGGQAQPWNNDGKPEWEVFTDAKTIPVIVIKGGLSQWMETYQGKTCVHRCDGEVNVLTSERCNQDDPNHTEAKPTTHLSVMLPELETIGAWHMVSRGWNAAAEIPAVAELAQYVGDLVPAHLNLMERRAIKDGKTSRFVVPVLDLQIGSARLREVVTQMSGGAAAIGGGAAPAGQQAIEAGPTGERPDYEGMAAAAASLDAVREIWTQAVDAGHLDDDLRVVLTARAVDLTPATQQPDEPVDAVVVDDQPAAAAEADPDVVWQQILATAGDLGASLPVVSRDFEQRMALAPGEASAGELAAYLQLLRTEGLDVQVPA